MVFREASLFQFNESIKTTRLENPCWFLDYTSCDTSLTKHVKQNTSTEVFKTLYQEREEYYTQENWNLLFTDGSKSMNGIASYAITNAIGEVLQQMILPEYSSVFSAEATAIKKAMCIALETGVKTIICTDSLSVIQTVLSPLSYNWDTVNQICDMLISNADILKIFWIPGHTNIPGNEKADQAAKNASLAPTLMVNVTEKVDIQNAIKLFIQSNKIKS